MGIENLYELIRDIDRYDAHVMEEKEMILKRESLETHIELTLRYFEWLWERKYCSNMLRQFCQRMFGSCSNEATSYLKQMIWGIPLFHDIGKANPAFQNKLMKNEKVKEDNVLSSIVSSKHSIISAVLYIDYFLQLLPKKVTDRTERKHLRNLIFYHAHVIARHHSDLNPLGLFWDSLINKEGAAIVDLFLTKGCDFYRQDFKLSKEKLGELSKEWEMYAEELSKDKSIDLYIYERLLYSLLVASDYYATAEFMSGMEIKDTGDLHEIESWICLLYTSRCV